LGSVLARYEGGGLYNLSAGCRDSIIRIVIQVFTLYIAMQQPDLGWCLVLVFYRR
jgi:hypothetical protein